MVCPEGTQPQLVVEATVTPENWSAETLRESYVQYEPPPPEAVPGQPGTFLGRARPGTRSKARRMIGCGTIGSVYRNSKFKWTPDGIALEVSGHQRRTDGQPPSPPYKGNFTAPWDTTDLDVTVDGIRFQVRFIWNPPGGKTPSPQ